MIYTWINKEGKPQGFFKDEHSLLVSYDLMPLRGLEETKRVLNQKGQIAIGELVECDSADWFVPFRNGSPDLIAIDWGCLERDYDRCLRALCAYVSFFHCYPEKNKFGISDEENNILRAFEWRMLSRDKRQRRPLVRLKPQAEKILAGLGFSIKAVEFVGIALPRSLDHPAKEVVKK